VKPDNPRPALYPTGKNIIPESGTSVPPELVFQPAIINNVNYAPVAVTTGEVQPVKLFRHRRGS